MSEQPEALRLADALEKDCWHITGVDAGDAATELRRLYEEVNQLNLAEEGAKEAYGVVVIGKQLAEAEIKKKQRAIFSQQEVIIKMRQQRNELLEALKLADALLRGANMNVKVVEQKVREAIEKAEAI